MRVTIICGHCNESTKGEDSAWLEVNFSDAHIHFTCPKCKKMNKLQLKKPEQRLIGSRRLGQ